MTVRAIAGGWVKNGRGAASASSLSLNFLNGITDYRITYSGGANGTRVNEAGVIVAAVAPRYDYNPVTLAARGLLVEEARTNIVRNNTMVGAVVGTPGTLPTNWTNTAGGGITQEIVGFGTENGISYIDIRHYGTAGATSGRSLNMDLAGVTSTIGFTWATSVWVALVGGALTNVSGFTLRVAGEVGGTLFTPTATLTRYENIRVISGTAVQPVLRWNANDTVTPIDFTLRIGLPQQELGAFVTSVIPTSTVAVTRTADSAVMTGTNFSSWYNQTEGTFVVRANIPENAAGSAGAVSVDNATVNERLQIRRRLNSDTAWDAVVADGGVVQAALSNLATTNQATVALAYAVNNFAACANGGTVATDVSGTLPTPTQMRIGVATGGQLANGWIQSIQYYPRRVSDSQLQILST